MTYLLDTNAFSDLMREHPMLDARLAGLGEADAVVLCAVVRGEILYGLGRLAPG
jgi:predicted nucleic acid-binding protein